MTLYVGIGGLGAIGLTVAKAVDQCQIPGLALGAVASRDKVKAARQIADFENITRVVERAQLAQLADVVVEAAPAAAFGSIAYPAVEAGRVLIPASAGQLLERPDLLAQAGRTGARIIVPTGALLGLDAVRAANEGHIECVTMETRKPPNGLAGAPYLVANAIAVDGLKEPLLVFDGTARAAARGFPANVNVAAALSLAGIGADRTRIKIWADPTVSRNTHTIKVEADSVRFEMKIENVPSLQNPRTGKLTPLSVLATLRALVAPVKAGT
ncbi:MAG: aspartate dehydrogenase [Gammaproteobacteria bacterium]|nr:aspartate dehydrogenase [Gammaproteobacteria bacterium]